MNHNNKYQMFLRKSCRLHIKKLRFRVNNKNTQ